MSGDKARHPFEARLGKWPDPRLGRILDKRVAKQLDFFPAQVEMDQAHTVMLIEQGILSAADGASILRVLRDLEAGGRDTLPIEPGRSSLFWYVEAALVERLGEHVGGRMHTGRSHNDIMPTVSRITARRRVLDLVTAVLDVETALLDLAEANVETIMPGYTALQHGQPWTFGHYAVGWSYAFGRDVDRLEAAFAHTNRSSLGASALAGTSWPLDRARTAVLLGFDGVMVNSRDAGFGTRDYVAEILAAIGIAMSNLNALCEDLYLWSSWEFSLIELGDGFSGTSSFMPQKKNAWAFDWVRGAAGNAIAGYGSALAALRGASSTDGSLQDYPEQPLSGALESATDCFALIAGALASIRLRTDVMADRARSNWATASNLAETIAREAGLSFREAHGIVGSVVRTAVEAGITPQDLTGAAVDAAARAIVGRPLDLGDAVVREALDPVRFIETRATSGSVNPAEVRHMIADRREALAAEAAWLRGRRDREREARRALDLEVERRIAAG